MRYNVYTKRKTIPFPVFFKCERCGQDTVGMNPFIIQASYNDQGTVTKSRLEEREIQADTDLLVQERTLFEKILKNTRERNVKDLGYTCVCSHCNAVPKWSRFRNKILEVIGVILSRIAILIAIVSLLSIFGYEEFPLYKFLLPLGLLIVAYVPRYIWYFIKECRVDSLDLEYMPLVCKSTEELQKLLPELATDRKKVMQKAYALPDVASSAQGWICSCGRENKAYASSCSCGITKAEAKKAAATNKKT